MNRSTVVALAWVSLLVSVLAGMAYAAFRPFERSPDNDTVLDTEAGALRFGSRGGSGIAHLTRPLSGDVPDARTLTVALWIRTADPAARQGQSILAIDDGRSPAVLRLGQKASFVRLDWRDQRRAGMRLRYLGRGNAFRPATEHFVAVVTSATGTRINVDGLTHPDVATTAPALAGDFAVSGATRVVFGNDATGRVGWRGDLLGYLITQRALGDDELAQLESRFHRRAGIADFDETGALVSAVDFRTRAALPPRLALPATLANLRRPVLQSDHSPPKLDALQNLFGFLPLGALLALAPGGWRRPSWGRAAAATLACCALSLSIELAQVQFPARFSSMYDWGLNTLGGGFGGLLAIGFAKLNSTTNVASPSNSQRGIPKS